MTSIIPLIFKYLPYLVAATKAVPEITTFIAELRTVFERKDIWTPAEKVEFDSKTEALRDDPAWTIRD